MCVLSLIAMGISKLVVIGGKEPLEASALVVVIGIILRNAWRLPKPCVAGVKAAEQLLVLGIVLMGFGLNYEKVFKGSGEMLSVILVTMSVGFISIYLLSRWAKLSEKLGALLAVGTCICGGTAIALVAPLIKAKEEETSYSVAVIALWGVAAVLLYPLVAKSLGVTDHDFGLFAGTAIHSTPQVVGAGFIFSEEAGELATAVKLIRNCFMAPWLCSWPCGFPARWPRVRSRKFPSPERSPGSCSLTSSPVGSAPKAMSAKHSSSTIWNRSASSSSSWVWVVSG